MNHYKTKRLIRATTAAAAVLAAACGLAAPAYADQEFDSNGADIPSAVTPATPAMPACPAAPAPAALVLGDRTVLSLSGTIGGLTPAQRIDRIDERITTILSNPGVTTDSVVVYIPPTGAPVIYILGRKAVTVDLRTAKAEGYTDPVKLAKIWAARFQQVLPRICWRPPSAPEPVVPAHPPLKVTHDLAEVGGDVGIVTLYSHVVMVLHGLQPGGLTAAERADMVHVRLQQVAASARTKAVDIYVSAAPDSKPLAEVDQIIFNGTGIYAVTPLDARTAHADSAAILAAAWADNIRRALHRSLAVPPPLVQDPADEPNSPAPPFSNAPIDPNDINKPPSSTGAGPAAPATPPAPSTPSTPPATSAPPAPSTPPAPSAPPAPDAPSAPPQGTAPSATTISSGV